MTDPVTLFLQLPFFVARNEDNFYKQRRYEVTIAVRNVREEWSLFSSRQE